MHGQEGFSTMGTNQKPKMRSITDLLNEFIQTFVQKPDATAGAENRIDFAAEFSQLKIENDLVNVFFDEIHRMSDAFTFSFIESLKHEIEQIKAVLFQSSTELSTFYTLLIMMLRRLSPIDGSFTNALMFAKELAWRISEDEDAPRNEFSKFFSKHLFRNYCSLIKECPNKRQPICELIFAHTQHDL